MFVWWQFLLHDVGVRNNWFWVGKWKKVDIAVPLWENKESMKKCDGMGYFYVQCTLLWTSWSWEWKSGWKSEKQM